MNRIRAFVTHFAISAVVVGLALALILLAWYPAPYFEVSGAFDVVAILVVAVLIAAPLMTLIVFRPGKSGLVFDLVVIALIQAGALAAGLSVIFQERPYYVVFAIDRFEILARHDVDAAAIDDDRLRQKPWAGPIYAVATMPDSFAAQQQLINDVLDGKPDIERRPEFWTAYSEDSDVVLRKATPLGDYVRDRPDAASFAVQMMASRTGGTRLVGLPVIGRKDAYVIVIEPADRRPIGMLPVNPWAPLD